jgi:large subunit ribosomal protein L21
VPKPDGSLSAVVVSGGKQYRVSPGDRILVDRIGAEPGSPVKLDRVVLFSDGGEVKVGAALEGVDVDARVIAHRRGPRVESIRYKSKKRVRVHRGGRAYLTALEIIAVGGVGLETEEEKDVEAKPKRGRAKAAPKKKAPKAESKATPEAVAETKEKEVDAAEAPKKTSRRRTKKETE